MGYHGKADVSLLEGGAVVSAVSRHRHHLSGFSHRAVNDAWLLELERNKKTVKLEVWTTWPLNRLPGYTGASKRARRGNPSRASSPLTRVCLSVGDERARTRSLGQTLSRRSCSTYRWWNHSELSGRPAVLTLFWVHLELLRFPSGLTSPLSFLICRLNSFPSRHRKSSPGCRMPHLVAMARAVLMLSPVTIRTVIPARWHLEIASGTWKSATKTWLVHLHNVKPGRDGGTSCTSPSPPQRKTLALRGHLVGCLQREIKTGEAQLILNHQKQDVTRDATMLSLSWSNRNLCHVSQSDGGKKNC